MTKPESQAEDPRDVIRRFREGVGIPQNLIAREAGMFPSNYNRLERKMNGARTRRQTILRITAAISSHLSADQQQAFFLASGLWPRYFNPNHPEIVSLTEFIDQAIKPEILSVRGTLQRALGRLDRLEAQLEQIKQGEMPTLGHRKIPRKP